MKDKLDFGNPELWGKSMRLGQADPESTHVLETVKAAVIRR